MSMHMHGMLRTLRAVIIGLVVWWCLRWRRKRRVASRKAVGGNVGGVEKLEESETGYEMSQHDIKKGSASAGALTPPLEFSTTNPR